jgi:ACS family hexuronate transporter-like MFS transporter
MSRRFTICGLLFFVTTVNYLDRQVFSLLAPTLEDRLGLDKTAYGDISAAFQMSYAMGLLFMGRLMDRLGSRRGFSVTVTLWSLAAMAHALARTALGFTAARAALGFFEAGNFPGAVKTAAEWFPKKERALAAGIFNAGSNVGATIAPIVVPRIAAVAVFAGLAGWQWAFVATGATGLVWLSFWRLHYRRPEDDASLSREELAHIRSDPPEPTARIPWLRLLAHRQAWAFIAGKALTDPIWWFYLTWLPLYLKDEHHLDLHTFGPPLVIIYLSADLGSIGGGQLSSSLVRRGIGLNRARKTAMLVSALAALPVLFAGRASSLWAAVAVVGVAAAAHQGWSSNLYTLVGDMFPKQAVASVVGLGGLFGSAAGALFQLAAGRIVAATGRYEILFAVAASAYLVALGVVHLLSPNLDPIDPAVLSGEEATR